MSRLATQPYQEAIDQLKKLGNLKSPMKKLNAIAKLNGIICKAVDEFWKGIQLDPDNLFIDADQFLCIFVYVIIKSHISDLFTHLNIINEFTTNSSRSNVSGYSLATLQACMYHILTMEKKAILEDESSSIPNQTLFSLANPNPFNIDINPSLLSSVNPHSL